MEVSALSCESSPSVIDLDLIPEAKAEEKAEAKSEAKAEEKAEAIADYVPFEGPVTSNVIER
jgi:hypothetical protein